MTQITKCDRCGTLDDVTPNEPVTYKGVRVDLCAKCSAETFGPWFAAILESVSTVPGPATVPSEQRPSEVARERALLRADRPPQHGFTADAIEAAQ